MTPARLIQKVRTHLKIRKDALDFQLKLSETQTKLIAMWVSQSKEALQMAKDISFTGGSNETKPEVTDAGGPPGTANKLAALFGAGVGRVVGV